jgi:hypothetical protein
MLPQNYGEWFRGESLSFSAGNKLKFKNDFLSKARNFAAPEIAEFGVQFTGSVGGVTATAIGIDAPKNFSRVHIKDKDVRCDASGSVLYSNQELEFGASERGALPATVASGSTNTAYNYILTVPYEFAMQNMRIADFRIPVPYILEGGIMQVNCASAVPTGWAAVQSDWTVTLWARVIDARTRELKSTLVYEQFNHSRSEDYFPIQGSARTILGITDLTTTDYTSWSTFTAINSKALELEVDMDPRFWIRRYQREKILDTTTTNLVIGQKAIPYVHSSFNQKIGAMPNLDQLDIRLQAAPLSNAVLFAGKIIERNMTLAAAWMGYDGPGELSKAVEAYGVIVDDHNTPYSQYDAILASRMPVRLKPAMAA